MAATPHSVTTLDDVEELLRSSKEKGEEASCCQLEADAAISAAVKLTGCPSRPGRCRPWTRASPCSGTGSRHHTPSLTQSSWRKKQ